jgi:guanylate kinase
MAASGMKGQYRKRDMVRYRRSIEGSMEGGMAENGADCPTKTNRRGVCFVISAPSGAGKSTIANALRASDTRLRHSVSVTTRQPRPGEREGVHYYFRSMEQFEAMAEAGEMLEWATVFGRGYGTPRSPVEATLAAGHDMVFDIDWQGHQQIRKALPADVVSLFVLPPSMTELERRLHGRASDHPEEIARRMAAARDEISHWREFDYVIVNTELDRAIAEARAVLMAARQAVSRQAGLADFVHTFGV